MPASEQFPQRKQEITSALDELDKKYGSTAAPATTQPAASATATWAPDPPVVAFYAAYLPDIQGAQGCAQCHTMKEDPAAPKPIEGAPALLVTAPTGIPSSPRHWFKKSVFDHRAHRNVTCVDCHSRAETSTLTTDVLSPNLAWTAANGAMRSCADCHHAPNADGRGATSNCQSCHVYHDRLQEGPPLDVTTIDKIVALGRERKSDGHGQKKSQEQQQQPAPATQPSGEAPAAAAR
jgi:predicted CxxxxCH...CXXCH cytochrome family protein